MLRRLIIGESGDGRGCEGCARGLTGAGGGARGLREAGTVGWLASSRFMALSRRPERGPYIVSADPTILGAYRGVGGRARNIAFSVAFLYVSLPLSRLFCIPPRLLFLPFRWLPRRCRRPPVNPGCPADTRQRCGEPTGWINRLYKGQFGSTSGESRRAILHPRDIPIFHPEETVRVTTLCGLPEDRRWILLHP